jgi:hypothetical protein
MPPSSRPIPAALARAQARTGTEQDALTRLADLRSSIERLRCEREALLAELHRICTP